MTAQIAGFVTRAAAGLRAPKSVSRNITPGNGGVAGHYGGPKQGAAEPDALHELCIKTWRGWQAYHMNTHGWADIAYTGGFCNHGYAFAGRGAGVRTAANGTNDGNQRFYAVTWIGGQGQEPTQAARDAFEWWVAQLRKQGAGRECRPHRYFKSTGCPGDPVAGECARLHLHDTVSPEPPPPPPAPPKPPAPAPDSTVEIDMARLPLVRPGDRGDAVRRVQALLIANLHDLSQEGGIDGQYGPGSVREMKAFQAARQLTADGIVGQQTWTRLLGAS